MSKWAKGKIWEKDGSVGAAEVGVVYGEIKLIWRTKAIVVSIGERVLFLSVGT